MNEWLDDFKTAVAFLTRLPMPHPEGAMPQNFVRAHRMFPVVGALIGAAVGLLCLGLRYVGVPDLAAAALALGGSAILTGALHEDGLADVADGFGGGRESESKLEIMRDSRLGTYGAVILLVSFAAKLSALAAIPDGYVVPSLIAAHALARGVLPAMSMNLPYARKDGLARNAGQPDAATAAIAGGLALRHRAAVAVVDQRAVRRARGGLERARHGAAGDAANRRPDRRRAGRRRAGERDRDPCAARGKAGAAVSARD